MSPGQDAQEDSPRRVSAAEAAVVADLLHAFNQEFATPSPGVAVLTDRLRRLLAGEQTLALLAGDPPAALALLSLRPSVWYAGPVAVLDELYVEPGSRGRGVGTALLAAAEGAVRARGGELVEINVDGDDLGARRFYERNGYVNHEPGEQEQLLYYYRELDAGADPGSGQRPEDQPAAAADGRPSPVREEG